MIPAKKETKCGVGILSIGGQKLIKLPPDNFCLFLISVNNYSLLLRLDIESENKDFHR